MATPLLHSFCGWCLYRGLRGPLKLGGSSSGKLAACLVLANLPDLDLLPRLIFGVLSPHGLYTHNLPAAAGVGLAVGFRQGRQWGLMAFILVMSHLVIDFFTGLRLGLAPSWGLAWLYPLEGGRWSAPATLFLGTRHGSWEVLFSRANLWAPLYEGCLMAALLALAWFRRRPPGLLR
ncbi:MAG: hypothetical protein FJ128_00140 [Deltaproteobacteria bacterium]|nr:hypothetical protein [Deltaproteobacteria bacterium]